MSTSCSFRITRTAEDLAQTINAISQRLVKLEQRQEVIELNLKESRKELTSEELKILDGVDKLLKECQDLLQNPLEKIDTSQNLSSIEDEGEDILAA